MVAMVVGLNLTMAVMLWTLKRYKIFLCLVALAVVDTVLAVTGNSEAGLNTMF